MKKIISGVLGVSIIASSLIANDVKIELDPVIENFVAENRIVIKANIEDEKGLDVVRTYFKSLDEENFSFVPMSCKKSQCVSTLPAPSASTKGINYLVLVKNGANEVYKTQTFSSYASENKEDIPAYQVKPTSESINVSTELASAPNNITGFSDNIVVDLAESTAKYGVVAGLYSSGSGAGTVATASTATGTTATGTVAATSVATLSTTAIVGGVVAAGAAAGAAGGGSSSSTSSTSSSSSSTSSSADIRGTWNYTYTYDDCPTYTGVGTITFGGTSSTITSYSISENPSIEYNGGNCYNYGSWSGSGSTNIANNTGSVGEVVEIKASGTSYSLNIVSENHVIVTTSSPASQTIATR